MGFTVLGMLLLDYSLVLVLLCGSIYFVLLVFQGLVVVLGFYLFFEEELKVVCVKWSDNLKIV